MKRKVATSKKIAYGILFLDGTATYAVLWFCYLSITNSFTGALPYLTTLIGALQASTAVILGAYFNKSKAENTQGGITYETAVKRDL